VNLKDEFPDSTATPIECEAPNNRQSGTESFIGNLKYVLPGVLFGLVLVKAEIISWYRIQEMFRFQSFHMYGVIGSAVITGVISVQIIKRLKLKTIQGEPVVFSKRHFQWGNLIGGTIFGFGWALTGACPGPLYAQIGSGNIAVIVTLISAIAGTWVYGVLQPKLPH
jgi:uncharacterized membrane protein YedE/YeeE